MMAADWVVSTALFVEEHLMVAYLPQGDASVWIVDGG